MIGDTQSSAGLIENLRFRGLLFQCTDEQGLGAHLASADLPAGGRRVYCGFDPTADSLTVGNLVPIMGLRHFQRAGHTPVVVMGGGTGLIGDPSGKSAERQLMSDETVAANVKSQRRIFESLLDFDPKRPNRAIILNNADWLRGISYLEVLRTVGKHMSVNELIKRDSVRDRLSREQGLSYTEFSYAILQAMDFLLLYHKAGVTVQMGGSDQWGNIIAGLNLIRHEAALQFQGARQMPGFVGFADGSGFYTGRAAAAVQSAAAEVQHAGATFGLTFPLVTKSDGGKFGKSESGAVWLTPERTSPFAFYQFWLNAADADVARFLRTFTLLPPQEIMELERSHAADPSRREAHRALARHMTTMLHGEAATRQAESATGALFSTPGEDQDFARMDPAMLRQLFATAPATEHPLALLAGDGISLVDLLAQTSLARSKTEARQHLQTGAVSLNGRKVGLEDRLRASDLLHNEVALLRRGKKTWHVTRWT